MKLKASSYEGKRNYGADELPLCFLNDCQVDGFASFYQQREYNCCSVDVNRSIIDEEWGIL